MNAKVHVCIRGVSYPSISAAARALGVHTSVVHRALDEGRLDSVGLYRTFGRPISITIDGIFYRTLRDAATATRLSNYKVWKLSREERGLEADYSEKRRAKRRKPRKEKTNDRNRVLRGYDHRDDPSGDRIHVLLRRDARLLEG